MRFSLNRSVTLIELIVAVTLVAVIILGINSINIFSNYQIISTDHRTKLQNDVSYCLDHIAKTGLRVVGNELGGNSTIVSIVANTSLSFFIDDNKDGLNGTGSDKWVRYALASNSLSYCDNCGNAAAPSASCSGTTTVLSGRITTFAPVKFFNPGNHLEVEITGRWDPSKATSTDNPEVNMHAAIQLPSVSTN